MKKLITICLVCLSLTAVAQATLVVNLVVPANPLWTDTAISLQLGDSVSITASGSWTCSGLWWSGPDGLVVYTDDCFSRANYGALIAYVGVDPYQGHWGDRNFFPQTSGYWNIGSSAKFTSDKTGELWLGFNDDAVSKNIGDNDGSVTALITPEPATICLLGLGALGLLRKSRA